MKRLATVAAVRKDWVDCLMLDPVEKQSARTCRNSATCGSTSCGCRVNGRPFKAAKPQDCTINPGDTVLVSAPAADSLKAFALVTGLPVLFAAAAWILSGNLPNQLSENLRAGLAAAAAGAAVFILMYRGKRRENKKWPQIISVVSRPAARKTENQSS